MLDVLREAFESGDLRQIEVCCRAAVHLNIRRSDVDLVRILGEADVVACITAHGVASPCFAVPCAFYRLRAAALIGRSPPVPASALPARVYTWATPALAGIKPRLSSGDAKLDELYRRDEIAMLAGWMQSRGSTLSWVTDAANAGNSLKRAAAELGLFGRKAKTGDIWLFVTAQGIADLRPPTLFDAGATFYWRAPAAGGKPATVSLESGLAVHPEWISYKRSFTESTISEITTVRVDDAEQFDWSDLAKLPATYWQQLRQDLRP